jgi:hypothetical protein
MPAVDWSEFEAAPSSAPTDSSAPDWSEFEAGTPPKKVQDKWWEQLLPPPPAAPPTPPTPAAPSKPLTRDDAAKALNSLQEFQQGPFAGAMQALNIGLAGMSRSQQEKAQRDYEDEIRRLNLSGRMRAQRNIYDKLMEGPPAPSVPLDLIKAGFDRAKAAPPPKTPEEVQASIENLDRLSQLSREHDDYERFHRQFPAGTRMGPMGPVDPTEVLHLPEALKIPAEVLGGMVSSGMRLVSPQEWLPAEAREKKFLIDARSGEMRMQTTQEAQEEHERGTPHPDKPLYQPDTPNPSDLQKVVMGFSTPKAIGMILGGEASAVVGYSVLTGMVPDIAGDVVSVLDDARQGKLSEDSTRDKINNLLLPVFLGARQFMKGKPPGRPDYSMEMQQLPLTGGEMTGLPAGYRVPVAGPTAETVANAQRRIELALNRLQLALRSGNEPAINKAQADFWLAQQEHQRLVQPQGPPEAQTAAEKLTAVRERAPARFGPSPVVPGEGTAEPRETLLTPEAIIRKFNIRTRAELQRHLPELSNEEAAAALRNVFGVAEGAAGAVGVRPGEETTTPAGRLLAGETIELPKAEPRRGPPIPTPGEPEMGGRPVSFWNWLVEDPRNMPKGEERARLAQDLGVPNNRDIIAKAVRRRLQHGRFDPARPMPPEMLGPPAPGPMGPLTKAQLVPEPRPEVEAEPEPAPSEEPERPAPPPAEPPPAGEPPAPEPPGAALPEGQDPRAVLRQQIIFQEREMQMARSRGDVPAERAAASKLLELRRQFEGPPEPVKPAIVPKPPLPPVSRQRFPVRVPGEDEPVPLREHLSEEIRRRNLRTKAQVQEAFPGISREQAAEHLRNAWGQEGVAPDAKGKVSPTGQVPPVVGKPPLGEPAEAPETGTPPGEGAGKEDVSKKTAQQLELDPILNWLDQKLTALRHDPTASPMFILPTWLAKDVASAALFAVKGAYLAGKGLKRAIEAGVEHLRNLNIKGFDETEARNWLRVQSPHSQQEDFGSRLGTSNATAKAATEHPITDQTTITRERFERNPKSVAQAAKIIRKWTPQALKDAGKPADQLTDKEVIDHFINHIKDNLVWLHDQMPPALRKRAKLWYDGARKVAIEWGDRYDMTKEAVSGVIASLSPQKDWFQNVDLARRVITTLKNPPNGGRWTEQMDKVITGLITRARKRPTYDEFGDLLPKELWKKDAKALSDQRRAMLEEVLNDLRTKNFKDLDLMQKAVWVRMWHEAHESKAYRVWSPEGTEKQIARNEDGTPTKVAWPSFPTIANAISIIEDGSLENISDRLGTEHKVRSFYNNIINPNEPHFGDVTIDTHAVAAGHLKPLGGEAREVKHNFGGKPDKDNFGPSNSDVHGISGLYALYAEAYRMAAHEKKLLPREMQSITWEAARSLFKDKWKTDKNLKLVEGLWDDYNNGKRTLDETRQAISDLAGGIKTPDWATPQPRGGVPEQEGLPGKPGELPDDSDVGGGVRRPWERGFREHAPGTPGGVPETEGSLSAQALKGPEREAFAEEQFHKAVAAENKASASRLNGGLTAEPLVGPMAAYSGIPIPSTMAELRDLGDPLREIGRGIGGAGKAVSDSFRDAWNQFSLKAAPHMTAMDRRTGELGVRFASSFFHSKVKGQVFAHKVLAGIKDRAAFDTKLGAGIAEDNLRSIKQHYLEQAEISRNKDEHIAEARERIGELAQDAKDGDVDAKKQIKDARIRIKQLEEMDPPEKFEEAAGKVFSFIGKKKSPFKTEKEYQDFLNSDDAKTAIDRHKNLWREQKDPLYRRANDLDPETPLQTRGLQTGARINLKGILEEEAGVEPSKTMTGKGTKVPRQTVTLLKNDPFGREAKGQGQDYEMSYEQMIKHGFTREGPVAAQHDWIKQMVQSGLAKITDQSSVPGFTLRGEPTVGRMLRINPWRGGWLQIPKSLLPEYDGIIDYHGRFEIPYLTSAMKYLTQESTQGLAEGSTHMSNLVMQLFSGPGPTSSALLNTLIKVGGGRIDFPIRVAAALVKGARAGESGMLDLIEIGAAKEPFGKRINVPFTGGKLSVWNPMGSAINILDRGVRLQAAESYKAMVEKGLVPDTETGLREYVNQMGQYNRRLQPRWTRALRDTHLSPFMTALQTFGAQGLRQLALSPGVKATSLPAAIALRADMLASFIGLAVSVGTINYLTSRNPLGPAGTHLGNIGWVGDDGKVHQIPVGPLVGATRGLRMTGAQAFLESKMQGLSTGTALLQDSRALGNTVLEPLSGPGPQFISRAFTGHRIGFGLKSEAKPAPPGPEFNPLNNAVANQVKNAIRHMNPWYDTASALYEGKSVAETASRQLTRYMPQTGPSAETMENIGGIVHQSEVNTYAEGLNTLARKLPRDQRAEYIYKEMENDGVGPTVRYETMKQLRKRGTFKYE